ncbi:peptidoglycan-binding protein [Streptomyces griseus]|uniref:peptidoglycan-binding protein n=1 Tax=Streptomyces griseus TaxID=1911 RepID=UPI0004C89FAD|nr:peptidoglycan-binding protein [Streptomyces griseus]
MRHRTAPTPAVAPPPHPVFGHVATTGHGGPEAREQDLALFDRTQPLPAVAAAPRRGGRHAPARRRPFPLPSLLVGVLVAGIGAALPVYLAARSAAPGPADPTVSMPDLPLPPPPDPAPDPAADTAGPTSAPTRTPPVRPAPARTTPPPATRAPATRAATAPSVRTTAPAAPARVTPPPTRSAPPSPAAPPASPPVTDPGPPLPSAGPEDGPGLGSSGPVVVEVQEALRRAGLYGGPLDGVFGTEVQEAVIKFQWSRGIFERPGVCGPRTLAALRGTPS